MSDKPKMPSSFMRQYQDIKAQHPDCILFFRMGDFYEMFNDDAIIVSRTLGLTLTGKNCGLEERAPMCGVPYHSADLYIGKLMQAGFKVAICEQVTNPQSGVKLLEREVVRTITPGTVTDNNMLEEKRNNYLMCLYKNKEKIGICYVDITTGEFTVCFVQSNLESNVTDILTRVMPSEVIANQEGKQFYDALAIMKIGQLPKSTEYYQWAFTDNRADENLKTQFGQNYAKVYELEDNKSLIYACGATLEYINETQKRLLKNINTITFLKDDAFMTLDMNTRRNLELVETMRTRSKKGSLLNLIDHTKTPMGGRKLRKYFDGPLQDSKEINARLDAVEELVKKIRTRDEIINVLRNIQDLERLAGKIGYGNIMPKEILGLKQALMVLPSLKQAMATLESEKLKEYREKLEDFVELTDLLEKSIVSDPPAVLKEGGYINDGFNTELDEYRNIKTISKQWIEQLEQKERDATGIKNLKISYNKVFGYYIEVNKSQSDLVPLRYQRKQTISNNERYITEDLKVIEDKVVHATEKSIELELTILAKIREVLQGYMRKIQQTADAIADIDALLSFAVCAVTNNFVRPIINKNIKHIKIIDGRHPVVESFLKRNSFIPNDTLLDNNENRIMIITGPNMAGKSTYMRQVAIITFLAHIGCFVPARSAEIAITDRIFTRVGASDDLVFGQSTFMVEMSEVATILANATDKSLIILDEIGRGTSTFDGLSIAWSVVEYLSSKYRSKTLFATHYHELTELEGIIDGVKNYKIAVKEIDENIVFLRKIVRGGANKSFGIEVARLAGLPQDVLDRSKEICKNLEKVNNKLDLNIFTESKKDRAEANTKKALSVYNRIKDIDINRVSPMHAFDILNDLVSIVNKDEED